MAPKIIRYRIVVPPRHTNDVLGFMRRRSQAQKRIHKISKRTYWPRYIWTTRIFLCSELSPVAQLVCLVSYSRDRVVDRCLFRTKQRSRWRWLFPCARWRAIISSVVFSCNITIENRLPSKFLAKSQRLIVGGLKIYIPSSHFAKIRRLWLIFIPDT